MSFALLTPRNDKNRKLGNEYGCRLSRPRDDRLDTTSLWGVNVVSGEATGIISLTFLHISAKIFIQEFYITHYENKQYKHDNI